MFVIILYFHLFASFIWFSLFQQNVHLVAKWLSTREKKIEQYSLEGHENYRLYISAEPAGTRDSHIIPQGILESAIKITNEPPTGMHANLHKALTNFNQVRIKVHGNLENGFEWKSWMKLLKMKGSIHEWTYDCFLRTKALSYRNIVWSNCLL